MKKYVIFIFILLVSSLICVIALSDKIETHSGAEYKGKIIEQNNQFFRIETNEGKLEKILLEHIFSISYTPKFFPPLVTKRETINGVVYSWIINDYSPTPCWSPDSKQIIYKHKEQHIVLANADGSNQKSIASIEDFEVYSPRPQFISNNKIFFLSPIAKNGYVFYDLERNRLQNFEKIENENQKKYYNFIDYSPEKDKFVGINTSGMIHIDDEEITFGYNAKWNPKNNNKGIIVYEYDGIRILDSNYNVKYLNKGFDPIWHPDGDKIIYNHWNGSIISIQETDLDGNTRTLLEGEYVSSISKDGSLLTYFSYDRGLGIYDYETGKKSQINPLGYSPLISPDGKKILYLDYSSENVKMMVYHLK